MKSLYGILKEIYLYGIFHVDKSPPVAKGTTASTEAAMLHEQIRGLADGKGVEDAALWFSERPLVKHKKHRECFLFSMHVLQDSVVVSKLFLVNVFCLKNVLQRFAT